MGPVEENVLDVRGEDWPTLWSAPLGWIILSIVMVTMKGNQRVA